MGIFWDSAEDKAKKASIDAHRAEQAFKESARILGALEARFNDISGKLPHSAPGSAMAPYARSLKGVRRHAEATLTHLQHLETHVKRAEEHLQKHQGGH